MLKKSILCSTIISALFLGACGSGSNGGNSNKYSDIAVKPHYVVKVEKADPSEVSGYELIKGEGNSIEIDGEKIDLLTEKKDGDFRVFVEKISDDFNMGGFGKKGSDHFWIFTTGTATPVAEVDSLIKSGVKATYSIDKLENAPILQVDFGSKIVSAISPDLDKNITAKISGNTFKSEKFQEFYESHSKKYGRGAMEGVFYGKNAIGMGGVFKVQDKLDNGGWDKVRNVIFAAKRD